MKKTVIDNLRLGAQHYTPALLAIYASGWKLYIARRRAYRLPGRKKVLIGPAWQPTRLSNPKFYSLDPLLSVERQLGTRGWNIDPIVDYLNQHSTKFVCDTFMHESELTSRPVDIVLICKTFDDISLNTVRKLKAKGVKLIYSIVDNCKFDAKCYLDHPEYMRLFDHIMLASPAHESDVTPFGRPFSYTPTPVINTIYKQNYQQNEPIRLLWNGFRQNLEPMQALFPLVREISAELGTKIEVVLNTNLPESREDGVHIVPWRMETWEDVMVSCDIAIVIKPPEKFWQSRKPATKVMTYMAAGLPTVCTPTVADEGIIRHGETAYAAYTEEDWRKYLKELAVSPERRQQIGKAARTAVTSQFSIARIARLHESLFLSLLQNCATEATSKKAVADRALS